MFLDISAFIFLICDKKKRIKLKNLKVTYPLLQETVNKFLQEKRFDLLENVDKFRPSFYSISENDVELMLNRTSKDLILIDSAKWNALLTWKEKDVILAGGYKYLELREKYPGLKIEHINNYIDN